MLHLCKFDWVVHGVWVSESAGFVVLVKREMGFVMVAWRRVWSWTV